MKGWGDIREELCSPNDPEIDSGIDSGLPDRKGLLGAGIVSLLLHMGFVLLLSLSLGPAITRGGPSVYQVTILPFPPPEEEIPDGKSPPDLRKSLPVPSNPLARSRIQGEDHELKLEADRREPVIGKHQEIFASAVPVKMENLAEEPREALPHQEEKDPVSEPIPLPVAEVSPLSSESGLTDHPPVLLAPAFSPDKPYENTIQGSSDAGPVKDSPDTGPVRIAGRGGSGWEEVGMGSGSGQRGSGRGAPGEGTGSGKEGSGRGGHGEGQGTGSGGFRLEGLSEGVRTGAGGFGKGSGSGEGRSGGGAGDGSGPGGGNANRGGFGKGGAGVARPRYVENPKPIYPLEAREKGYQGEVLLRVEVLPDGRVGQIEVKRSSGHEVLDRSALATVKKWKFIPAGKGEVAIPFWVNIPIKFELL